MVLLISDDFRLSHINDNLLTFRKSLLLSFCFPFAVESLFREYLLQAFQNRKQKLIILAQMHFFDRDNTNAPQIIYSVRKLTLRIITTTLLKMLYSMPMRTLHNCVL